MRSSPAEPTLLKMHTARDALEEIKKIRKRKKKRERQVRHEEAGDWLVMYSESSLDVLSLSCPLESQRVSTQFLESRRVFFPWCLATQTSCGVQGEGGGMKPVEDDEDHEKRKTLTLTQVQKRDFYLSF